MDLMGTQVTAAASFIAGLLSFASPCVLPLIGTYLFFISGSSTKRDGTSVFFLTLFFVAGFSIVFIVFSAIMYGFMFFLGGAAGIINFVAGLVIIALGFNIIFNFIPFLKTDSSAGTCETCTPEHSILKVKNTSILHPEKRPRGAAGALLAGAAFGASWTPCVGVILGSILVMAQESGKLLLSCIYLGFYSLGLGLPFLVCGFLWTKIFRRGFGGFIASRKFKRIAFSVRVISGVFLIIIGILISAGHAAVLTLQF